MSVAPRKPRSTLTPEALNRLTTLFESPHDSPKIVLERYWDRYATIKEIRQTHSLKLGEVSRLTNTSKRKIEYMLAVCETISTKERDRYVKVAASAGRIITPKVLESIASHPPRIRRRAVKEWAARNLSLRALIRYLHPAASADSVT